MRMIGVREVSASRFFLWGAFASTSIKSTADAGADENQTGGLKCVS
jgi:hypothetical protein